MWRINNSKILKLLFIDDPNVVVNVSQLRKRNRPEPVELVGWLLHTWPILMWFFYQTFVISSLLNSLHLYDSTFVTAALVLHELADNCVFSDVLARQPLPYVIVDWDQNLRLRLYVRLNAAAVKTHRTKRSNLW